MGSLTLLIFNKKHMKQQKNREKKKKMKDKTLSNRKYLEALYRKFNHQLRKKLKTKQNLRSLRIWK